MEAQIWESTIPLLLTHPTSPIPYLINVPRLSYLPLLLPRLTSFYSHTQNHSQSHNSQSASASQTTANTGKNSNAFEPLPITSFSYEGIQLKNLPVGLLYDLYQPELPWRLELGNGPLFDIHDTFYNSVKEADFVRNGTAKGIMSLSKENSTDLWNAVQDNDYTTFARIKSLLLNPSHNTTGPRNIPLRIYIPSSPTESATFGSFKTVQVLVPPRTESREIQTVGSALHTILPTLFPSRRDAILAEPVLHGAPVPFKAPLEEIMRDAAYADGWIHLCVEMLN